MSLYINGLTFIPDTESRPLRMHSFKPVQRRIPWYSCLSSQEQARTAAAYQNEVPVPSTIASYSSSMIAKLQRAVNR